MLFQSTLPGWGATRFRPRCPVLARDFNPRSPDGERPESFDERVVFADISIHAPRMGSDAFRSGATSTAARFQSTLPGWGATPPTRAPSSPYNFNPRSPDGERQGGEFLGYAGINFNPRSPDGERPRKWTSSPTIWAKSSIFNTDCIADRR